MQPEVELATLICQRCGHEWVPRVKSPKRCPNCLSPYWATPKSSTKDSSDGKSNPQVETTHK